MARDCPGHLSGRRRKGPRISIRCNRIQLREGFLLWEAKEKLPDMLAEVLPPGQLAPVFAVVHDRLRCGSELDPILLDPREDDFALPRALDALRVDWCRSADRVL